MRWLLVLVACAGCKRSADAPPPPDPGVPVMPAGEVKRDQDACKAYVDKVCACAETTPAMQTPCAKARAFPDAMQVSLEIAAAPDTKRRDVLQAHESVRNIAKKCIEETAKLPAAGCP